MKKLYTAIAIVAMAFTTQAQTPLNTNGSLEDWTDGTTQPDGWFISSSNLSNGIISKIEGDAQDGDISLKIEARAGSSGNNNGGLQDIEVTAGETYTVSFWYKSEGNELEFKHWIQWRTLNEEGNNVNLPENVETFQPGDSHVAVSEWTEVVVSEVAPEGAIGIRVNFRNYANSSDIYIDNVTVYEGTASVKDNNIEGLNIYPNPANDLVNVVSSSLSNKDVVITNLLGKTVLRANVSQTVNISSLSAGVYMMQITQDGKSATRKLVVK